MQLRKRLDPTAVQEEEEELSTGNENSKDRTAVLAIAYHNMGVEQEFLRSYPAAILSYKKAVNFAEKNLGAEDGITQNLRNVYENAKNELDVAVFRKKKAAGSTGTMAQVPPKVAKTYGASSTKQQKKVMQSMGGKTATQETYESMITPRNVSIFVNRDLQMERVDEADEELHDGNKQGDEDDEERKESHQ